MSDKEFKERLDSIDRFNKEVSSSKEKSRAVLVEIGVLDKDGRITEAYKKTIAVQSTKSDTGVSRNGKSGSR